MFDENGKFLDMWPLRSPHWPASQSTLMVNHFIDQNGFIWVGDAPTNRILKFDLNGNYPVQLGRSRRTARTARLLARDDDRSTRESVRRRLFRWAGAEVRADSRRRSAKIAGQILRTWDTWKKS